MESIKVLKKYHKKPYLAPSKKNVLILPYNLLDVIVYILGSTSTTKILMLNPDLDYLKLHTNISSVLAKSEDSLLYPIDNDGYGIIISKQVKITSKHYNLSKLSEFKFDVAQLEKPVFDDIYIRASYESISQAEPINLASHNITIPVESCQVSSVSINEYESTLEISKIIKDKLQLLIDYSVNEQYDCLIIGNWIMEVNAVYLEELDRVIYNTFIGKLNIILTSEILSHYKLFQKYIRQTGKTFTIKNKQQDLIKHRIQGLIWGVALSDAFGSKYEEISQDHINLQQIDDTNQTDQINWTDDTDQTDNIDWTDDTDQTVLLLRSTLPNIQQTLMNMSKWLVYWKNNGFKEIGDTKGNHLSKTTEYVLSHSDYLQNPLDVSHKAYNYQGCDNAHNSAIMRNAINGIFDDWKERTIKLCQLTHWDTRCIVSCYIHSFIISSIWKGKFITEDDWTVIFGECIKIIQTHKGTSNNNSLEFNKYWQIGRNYQYKISDGFQKFMIANLDIGNYEKNKDQSYTFIPLALSIAIIYDIQNIVIKNYKKNIIDQSHQFIPDNTEICSELKKQNIDFGKYLPSDYYFTKIREIMLCGGCAGTNCSIIGAIIGLACYKDIFCRKSNTLSEKWIKSTKHSNWLNNEIILFLQKYFTTI